MRIELLFDKERIMIGVNKLAKAVSSTLGGAGKNVMLVDNLLPPKITKDGITVAKAITLDDFVEQAGVEIVRQASARSAKEVGDGTTTATVLSAEILNVGVDNIGNYNVHDFKKGMEKAYQDVSEQLELIKEDVSDNLERLTSVATISANGDREIGEVVAKLIYELGSETEILITEDKVSTSGIHSKIKQGYTFNRGSNQFFETKSGTGVCQYDEARILIVDKYVARITQLSEALDYCGDNGYPLVILYETIDNKTLENLILSKLNMSLKVCAVEFPDAGELQQLSINDIATATGAKVVTDLDDFDAEKDLGRVKQFKSDTYSTTLLFEDEFSESVNEICNNIRENLDNYDGYKLSDAKERLKRLSKGIGEIYIGSSTDIEYGEIFDRVEDAVGAVKSAMQEGIVIGGGVALLKAIKPLEDSMDKGHSFNFGYQTVINACKKPFYQILENAGLTEEEIGEIYDKIEESNFTLGYNSRQKEIQNLSELGIVDPKKVTRSALLAAVSVSSSILTTDCIIYPKTLSVG